MCLILYLFNSCMLGLHPSALFNNMTLFIKKNIYQVSYRIRICSYQKKKIKPLPSYLCFL
jgi:hypothetical protein